MKISLRTTIFQLSVLIIVFSLVVGNSYAGIKLKEIEDFPQREYESIMALSGRFLDDINEKSQIKDYAVKTKIYDISAIVYREEFADRYDWLKGEFIDNTLPKELKAIELSMITEGKNTSCYVSMLIDNKVKSAMPEEGFRMFMGNDKMKFPGTHGDYAHWSQIDRDFINNVTYGKDGQYRMNAILATHDYNRVPDKKRSGGMDSVWIIEYSKRLFADVDYYKIDIYCGNLGINILKAPNPQIWIKKKNGADYSKISSVERGYKSDEFYKFSIPKKIINKIMPYMEERLVPSNRLEKFYIPNSGIVRIKNYSNINVEKNLKINKTNIE
jgi:hypothetical protein